MLKSLPTVLAALLLTGAAHAQALQLEDCRISAGPGAPSMKARCGTLTRPLDPAGEVSGEIELRVAVVPALSLTPEPDPVVPIAGGPGQGSVLFYTSYSSAFEEVRRNRDILLVDQRGTGESATMDCEFDDDIVEGQYSTELTVKYTQECLDRLPYDARFFTTSVAVTDLEAVRAALGYATLNLYGVSYGSRVAQHFARQYPDSTRTIVIDGVVPPQESLGPEIATESQRAIDDILARCAEDDDCNERFPDVQDDFTRVVKALRDSPVTISVPHPNTGRPEELQFGEGEFATAIRLLAYRPYSIALIPLMVSEAGDGNFVPLGSQFSMTLIALMDALSLGMHNSVMCTEDVPFYDTSRIDYTAIEASYMGTFQLEALEAICSVWPQGPLDSGFKAPLSTDIPVLLLSGDADPITPPRYADLAMVDLTNAVHLTGVHQGHGQLGVGCTPRLFAEFVETADPAALDASCMERSFVMPFFLDFSGPKP
ncbi:MAG: alpha/beta hydrolase [Gammaproteobacteria bacterium]|nr:alpha/beta hydrolase [Gammaproteobacteria bacterium]